MKTGVNLPLKSTVPNNQKTLRKKTNFFDILWATNENSRIRIRKLVLDPDSYQNVTDSQHWCQLLFFCCMRDVPYRTHVPTATAYKLMRNFKYAANLLIFDGPGLEPRALS